MNAIKTIFFLFNPHLSIRKLIIDYRKNKAIKKALALSAKTNANIYVVQIGRYFKVGTREELRRFNKNGRKNIRRLTKTYTLDFNCKYSIIFTAKNGTQQT
jgi:hypothetical protein